MSAPTSLLSFPEELLERILEEVVLFSPSYSSTSPSSSSYSASNPEAPSSTLGPSPISTPSTTPKSTPSATRHVSPHASPIRSRPSSPVFGRSTSGPSVNGSPAATYSTAATSSEAVFTPLEMALAPLLTCRQLSRIALPLYYRVVILKTRAQAATFLCNALGHRMPEGAEPVLRLQDGNDTRRRRTRWIRRLVFSGIWKEGGEVVRVLAELVQPSRVSLHQRIPALPMQKTKGKGKAKVHGDDREHIPERNDRADTIALTVLEITIDVGVPTSSTYGLSSFGANGTPNPPIKPVDEDADMFASALRAYADSWTRDGEGKGRREIRGNPLRHIVLRKPQNVYLTQPRAKSVIAAVASVVEGAEALESAFVAFRISDDPQGMHPYQQHHQHHHSSIQLQTLSQPQPISPQLGPITQFTSALASRPKLKTFVTMLPSVWNEAVLRVSNNEALEKVVLLGVNGMPIQCTFPTGPAVQDRIPHLAPIMASNSPIPPIPNNRRPRLALTLPPNPVERVYASSARGVDGYALAASPSATTPTSIAAPPHPSASSVGYGGIYVPGYMGVGTGTGLFLNQAKKHERLCALIKAGSGDSDNVDMGNSRKGGVPVIAIPVPHASKKTLAPASDPSSTGATMSDHPSATGANAGSNPTLYASCSSWFSTRFSNSGSSSSLSSS